MPPKIPILATIARTPLGDLSPLWQLWLSDSPPPQCPSPQPDNWHAQTNQVATEISQSLTPADLPTTGFILATTKADIESQVAWMRQSIPNTPLPTLATEAARLATLARITGPIHAVSTACSSGLTAVIDAAIMLQSGEASKMIILAADQATSFVHEGFTALKALSLSTCKPFDKSRDGLTLGSAAAAVLLSGSTTPRVPQPLITGYGLSNDATHMTAPDQNAAGLIRAIQQALEMAHLHPEDIDVLLAHATGTKYNDAMEALAIQKIFQQKNQKGPAVTALKSLLGHTLGASALLELTLATKILEHQLIPKIHNLTTSDFPHIDFVTVPRKTKIRHLLKTASGFGGYNAAVILSTPN